MLQASLFKDTPMQSTGGTKVPVGVHNGGVFFQGLNNEAGWTDINFTSKDGRSIHKRLFTPTGSFAKSGENIQDAYNREVDRNLKSLVHVMEALLGAEVVETFGAADYKGFISAATLLLTPLKGTEVNLKVVPDWKEGVFPDLPMTRFVEKHQEGVAPQIRFSKKEEEAVAEMEAKRNAPKEEEVVTGKYY